MEAPLLQCPMAVPGRCPLHCGGLELPGGLGVPTWNLGLLWELEFEKHKPFPSEPTALISHLLKGDRQPPSPRSPSHPVRGHLKSEPIFQ